MEKHWFRHNSLCNSIKKWCAHPRWYVCVNEYFVSGFVTLNVFACALCISKRIYFTEKKWFENDFAVFVIGIVVVGVIVIVVRRCDGVKCVGITIAIRITIIIIIIIIDKVVASTTTQSSNSTNRWRRRRRKVTTKERHHHHHHHHKYTSYKSSVCSIIFCCRSALRVLGFGALGLQTHAR